MKLSNGYGKGIGYKEVTYTGRGVTIYDDRHRFRIFPYITPKYNLERIDYNLIFNLNEKI